MKRKRASEPGPGTKHVRSISRSIVWPYAKKPPRNILGGFFRNTKVVYFMPPRMPIILAICCMPPLVLLILFMERITLRISSNCFIRLLTC